MTRQVVSLAYYKWVLGGCLVSVVLGIGVTLLFKNDPLLEDLISEPTHRQIARQMVAPKATPASRQHAVR